MAAAKSWFVKAEFGTCLGPMPDDALKELIRTGALVRTDRVREATTEDWRSASEIPGLFEAELGEPAVLTEVSVGTRERVEPVVSSPDPKLLGTPLIPPEPPVRAEAGSSLATEPASSRPLPVIAGVVPASSSEQSSELFVTGTAATSAHDTATAEIAAPQVDEMIKAWKLERARSTEELGAVSLAADMTQSEVDDVLVPELPLLEEVRERHPAVSTKVTVSSRPLQQRPAFLDQVAGLEDGPRQPIEAPRQSWDRWRRSLPSWPIVAALVVLTFATWWLWPRSQRGIYHRYVELWSEWKARRVDLKDKAGWEQFLRRAEAELEDIVPELEKSTRPTDSENMRLLFIGRDCLLKMLPHPRQIGSPQERQLELLLAQAQAFYEPSEPAQPREAFIGAKSSPPSDAATQSSPKSRSTGAAPLRSEFEGQNSKSPNVPPSSPTSSPPE